MKLRRLALATEEPITAADGREARILRFRDPIILKEMHIQEIGQELLHLIQGRFDYCISFNGVTNYSSAANGNLITADDMLKERGRCPLVLARITPNVYEVFKITGSHEKFPILRTEEDFIKAYQAGCKTTEEFRRYKPAA